MKRRLLISAFLGSALSLGLVLSASAQTTHGSQLMTPQERAEHRSKMRSLPPAEREAYRAEHHERMRQRAEAKDLTMPETVPPRGQAQQRRGRGWDYPGMGRWEPGSDFPYHRGSGYGYPGGRGFYGHPGFRGPGYPGRWRGYGCPGW
jgi:Ni/Co efflux regulator RcnB